jgi:DNA polymerase/3'-5' exonuclease PolX
MEIENNKKIAEIFRDIVRLLDIKGKIEQSMPYRKLYYEKAANSLESSDKDVNEIYKESGIKGLKDVFKVGDKMAKKIKEYLAGKKIKDYEDLKEDTALQQIIAYFFQTKGISLPELKYSAKKRKIIYSRFTKPAKQLLELSGSVQEANEAIKKVADWANSRKLDYAIETVFKKWLELDKIKPKEQVKKAFYKGNPMYYVESKKKWFVVTPENDWLEFAGKEADMEWRNI